MTGVIAIIPMKSPMVAKSRLATVLDATQREVLTLNMLHTVVRAAVRAKLDQVWVVGGDAMVRQVAEMEGASWYEDELGDLNGCLSCSFKQAARQGLAPLYLPGDLPLLDWPDIQPLLAVFRQGRNLVIAPDTCGQGTNALLVPTGVPFCPSLGPGSFQRHLRLAESAGIPVCIYHGPALSLDLDTPDDLARLRDEHPVIMQGLLEEVTSG